MYGFAIDENGDAIIENNDIKLVSDKELIRQTVKQVLSTNLGEWWLNENEGIAFNAILKKNPQYDQIEDTVKSGLLQIDKTFELTSFICTPINRTLKIEFTARNESGEEIDITL